jgi:hypothetical protein
MGAQVIALASVTPGITRYSWQWRLSGNQGRCGRVRKISLLTGIGSLDSSARSESLYRMRNPGPRYIQYVIESQL